MLGLKICPFCGSEAVLRSGKNNPHNLYAPVYCAYVKCSVCTASVANFVSDCAEDRAIEVWNSRAEIAVEKITSPNSAMVPCCGYTKGGLCKLFISWKCGSAPCQVAQHQ